MASITSAPPLDFDTAKTTTAAAKLAQDVAESHATAFIRSSRTRASASGSSPCSATAAATWEPSDAGRITGAPSITTSTLPSGRSTGAAWRCPGSKRSAETRTAAVQCPSAPLGNIVLRTAAPAQFISLFFPAFFGVDPSPATPLDGIFIFRIRLILCRWARLFLRSLRRLSPESGSRPPAQDRAAPYRIPRCHAVPRNSIKGTCALITFLCHRHKQASVPANGLVRPVPSFGAAAGQRRAYGVARSEIRSPRGAKCAPRQSRASVKRAGKRPVPAC